jgi:hypothetical protein
MLARSLLAAVAIALGADGAALRAQPAPQAPLRFTLDPAGPAPAAKAQIQIEPPGPSIPLAHAEAALEAALARQHHTEWNCGMPVIHPPPDVDPGMELRVEPRTPVPIRRAAPRACGR